MNVHELLDNWRTAQKSGAQLPCPRCGMMKMKSRAVENALSRRADIYVCGSCGNNEAMEDMGCKYHSPTLEVGSEEYNERLLSKWWLVKETLGCVKTKFSPSGEYELDVRRRAFLTTEDIDDIMCGALEGGINYWCNKAEVVEDEYFGEYASEQIARGGSLRLHDREEDDDYILDLDKFLTGFVLACKKGYANNWFQEDDYIDVCHIDSVAADIIVQLALFGEVVYG